MKRMMMLTGIVCAVFFAGCSLVGGPSSAARRFYAAVDRGDTKALEQAATPETVQLITMYGEKAKGMLTSNGRIKSTTEKIDGNTAVVTLTFENGETTDLDLIKTDGKWKVTIKK